MPNFRSLTPGGFFSADPFNPKVNVSIRTNNPGALNVAPWIKSYPGFVGDKVTSNSTVGGQTVGNSTVIFETPEQGVAAWWELMRKYQDGGHATVGQIINRYGGGQDYSAYVATVLKWSGLSEGTKIDLGDNRTLLPFAKAMFRYEAGMPTPLSDAQITLGFNIGRVKGKLPPASQPAKPGLFSAFMSWLGGLIKRDVTNVPAPVIVSKGAPWVDQVRRATGIQEVPGAADNPVIMGWREDIAKAFPKMRTYAYTYQHDSTPWCGHGLAAALARVGIEPPFGSTPELKYMWADSYAHWGTKLPKPIPGCIMVFTRNGGGHVAMLEKIDGNTLWVRGFNQSDEVNVSTKALNSTFTAAVWPPGYAVVPVVPNISNAVEAGKES